MKRFFVVVGIVLVGVAGALGIMAARFQERIRPNTFVGLVDVGDLTKEEAAKKIRLWWETEKVNEVTLNLSIGNAQPIMATPGKLGITVDDTNSIESLPLDTFMDSTGRVLGQGEPQKRTFPVKFKSNGQDVSWLKAEVKKRIPPVAPAQVRYEKGAIIRKPEGTAATVDLDNLGELVMASATSGWVVDLPVTEAEKNIPDEELAKIKEVVASYSTNFPAGQRDRNANLKIASGKIDGLIMMPGDVFSFNEVVGRRTIEDGYRLAPVLANGRHDVGVGGGICQVSGTLFNAVLLADLEIVHRSNHSMPVAYLPVGRDATVSYGSLDFKFRNNTKAPIAISRSFEAGRLTFRVLGSKVPGQTVKIVTSGHRSWGNGIKYVEDKSLPPGKSKVVEKGSSGHSITTYRVVYLNGKEVRRDKVSYSHYPGGKRIIARNSSAPAASPVPSATPSKPAPIGGTDEAPEEFGTPPMP